MANKHSIIEIYLDWVNNFLSLEAFAEYYELTSEQASLLIELGKSIHEAHVKFLRSLDNA